MLFSDADALAPRVVRFLPPFLAVLLRLVAPAAFLVAPALRVLAALRVPVFFFAAPPLLAAVLRVLFFAVVFLAAPPLLAADLRVLLRAVLFFAVLFLAVPAAFFAAGLRAVLFLAAPAFFAAGLRAVDFFAAPAVAFFAAGLRAVVFFAPAAFLVPVLFLAAPALEAVDFFAVDFLAVDFLAPAALRVVLPAAFLGPDDIVFSEGAVAGEIILFLAAFRFLGFFATIFVPPSRTGCMEIEFVCPMPPL